jgi:hypothetical protein
MAVPLIAAIVAVIKSRAAQAVGVAAAKVGKIAYRAYKIYRTGRRKFEQWKRNQCKNCKLDQQVCAGAFGGGGSQPPPYRGGAYSRLGAQRGVTERHHMPPKGSGGLGISAGPAIQMDRGDHASTLGHGGSGPSYRKFMDGVIKTVGVEGAFLLEAGMIALQFPGKYNEAMAEAGAYIACLKAADAV